MCCFTSPRTRRKAGSSSYLSFSVTGAARRLAPASGPPAGAGAADMRRKLCEAARAAAARAAAAH